jgi:hypothetical protein
LASAISFHKIFQEFNISFFAQFGENFNLVKNVKFQRRREMGNGAGSGGRREGEGKREEVAGKQKESGRKGTRKG